MILFPLFAAGILDTSGNLLPVSTTPAVAGAKFAIVIGVIDTCGAPSLANISSNMTLMLYMGAWGKIIHEKNLKQKIS
jgi:hypothetical protein